MKLKLLFLLLLIPAIAYPQGATYNDRALGVGANYALVALPYASVRVCSAGAVGTSCSPLAVIYTNAALTVQASNPFLADAGGNFTIYAPPGNYVVQTSAANFATSTLNASIPVISTTGVLGNGNNVLDVASQFPSTFGDFSQRANAAITACNASVYKPCIYDLRGFTGAQVMAQTITFPVGSDTWMPHATISRSTSAQFIVNTDTHFHGPIDGDSATVINSANITTDYTPVFQSNGTVGNVEIDHIKIGATTPAGPQILLASVATSVAGYAVYSAASGLDTMCPLGSTALYGFKGFALSNNEGFFQCNPAVASTSTTVSVNNAQASAETPSATTVNGPSFAFLSGAWGISGHFNLTNWHDLNVQSDMGISCEPDCFYDTAANVAIGARHGALYLGTDTNDFFGYSIKANANDQGVTAATYATAVGFGFWLNRVTNITLIRGSSENTKYPMSVQGSEVNIIGLDPANDFVALGLVGGAAITSLPTIKQSSFDVNFDNHVQYFDWTRTGNIVNFASNSHRNGLSSYPEYMLGSVSVNNVLDPGNKHVTKSVDSGDHTTQYYWMVPVDVNGALADTSSSVVGKGLPVAIGSIANTPDGVGVNNLSITGQTGAYCYDILRSATNSAATAGYLQLCYPPTAMPYLDGAVSTTAYTAPTRDATADIIGGSNIIYRCLTAGVTLPTGSLTIVSGACGTSSDTGLRIQ